MSGASVVTENNAEDWSLTIHLGPVSVLSPCHFRGYAAATSSSGDMWA